MLSPPQLSDPGPLPELAWLPVDRCSVDPRYQRSLERQPSPRHIEKITENFRWARFQAVLAVKANLFWLIIDGQHRVEAARRRGIKHVPAVVLADIDAAEQADAFVWANRDRLAVSAQAIFRAELAAGKPEAVTLDRLTRAAGVEIIHYRISNAEIAIGKTAAVSALRRLLRLHGEAIAGAAIRAVATLKTERGALRAELFRAAARYLETGRSETELSRSLAAIGWQKLADVAAGGRGEDSRANAIVDYLRRPAPAAALPAARAALPTGRFEDDPRAKRDPGSTEKLGRAETFGRSATGSSLA